MRVRIFFWSDLNDLGLVGKGISYAFQNAQENENPSRINGDTSV